MKWQVVIPKRIGKMIGRLPIGVKKSLLALLKEIEIKGPADLCSGLAGD